MKAEINIRKNTAKIFTDGDGKTCPCFKKMKEKVRCPQLKTPLKKKQCSHLKNPFQKIIVAGKERLPISTKNKCREKTLQIPVSIVKNIRNGKFIHGYKTWYILCTERNCKLYAEKLPLNRQAGKEVLMPIKKN